MKIIYGILLASTLLIAACPTEQPMGGGTLEEAPLRWSANLCSVDGNVDGFEVECTKKIKSVCFGMMCGGTGLDLNSQNMNLNVKKVSDLKLDPAPVFRTPL